MRQLFTRIECGMESSYFNNMFWYEMQHKITTDAREGVSAITLYLFAYDSATFECFQSDGIQPVVIDFWNRLILLCFEVIYKY